MAQPAWVSSKKFSGVRWYAHPSRKKGVKFDRCFGIRYTVAGKRFEAILGWEGGGWSEESAHLKRLELIENAKKGSELTTPKKEKKDQKTKAEAKARDEEAKAMSFERYFEDRYLPEASTRKKAKSIAVEKQHVKDWLSPVLEGKPMREVNADDLEAVKANILKAGRTFRTVQHVLANFRLVWNHALKKARVVTMCPVKAIELPKIENARTRFLAPAEISALLAEVQKRDQAAYELALAAVYTGARLGELAALTWAGVNLDEGHVDLIHTKTAKPRSIPLAAPLRAILAARDQGKPGELVFQDGRGNPWREMPWAFRLAVEALKLNDGRDRKDRVCFHSLRHSAATAMLAAGVDVRSLQSIFGWSTLAMAGRYSHAVSEAKTRAVAALEAALEPKSGKLVPFRRAAGSE